MSKTYTPYFLETGLFHWSQLTLDEESLASNTPDGCVMMEGAHDHLAVKVDLKTGLIVERTESPASTGAIDWAFDSSARKWMPKPNVEVRSYQTRKIRDSLLDESDKVVTRASEKRQQVSKDWEDYRQALRDLPTHPDFPDIRVWPTKPSSM